MRILYLIKAFAEKGGVERVICDKMNYLANHGYEIIFITYTQGSHPLAYTLDSSIRYYDLNTRFFELGKYNLARRITEHIKLRSIFKHRLQQIIDEEQPGIIITTTFQFWLTDIISNLRTNAIKLIESHIGFEQVLFSEVHKHDRIISHLSIIPDRFFLSKIKKFNALISLTKGDAKEWKKYINNVIVIPNPVTHYLENSSDIYTENSKRIICVGRLAEQKGLDLLIKAFAMIANQCPQWHIDIFGHGEDKEKLINLIKENELHNQIYINPPTTDIYKEYKKSSFLVLSSRHEGYPLVLNEAMSCGIPCVAFSCKYGPEDAIFNKENGLLVENGNIEKLAEAMLWMINHPKERIEMSKAARESSLRYKIDTIMREWENLFSSFKSTSNDI